ncbi:MAG: 1-acyl-sn-glycerol-3-phosphate acyltransferase [Prevotella sp.]|nr:1-acyl-sn-glycerol-3-phosphate acyltransferase [Prevotella sp.]
MKYLYYLYQVCVALPVTILATILTAVTVGMGCTLGNGHFWGYYPGHWWAKVITRAFLLPVKVEGREHLEPNQSYVFVANHQGAFDIFLIYGFLERNFKWMMKHQINKIPFVGYACRKSHQIFVDKRGVGKVRQTYEAARRTLQTGNCSVVVFPEGARSFTGHMGAFKKGAFMLADELQLPVVPLTINGSFNVMPRMRDWHFVHWHPLSLTIHQPIYPVGQGSQNVQATMNQAYDSVMSALAPEYQGFMENPDQ